MYDDVQGGGEELEQPMYDDVQGIAEPDQPLYDDAESAGAGTGGGGGGGGDTGGDVSSILTAFCEWVEFIFVLPPYRVFVQGPSMTMKQVQKMYSI